MNVTHYPVPDRDTALRHFEERLALSTDPSDVYADQVAGSDDFVIVDARSSQSFEAAHIPGAINLPHRTMSLETTAKLDRAKVYVVYCDGNGCNASTKGAYKLTQLGFKVKELIGGIDWWQRDGYAVHSAETGKAAVACGC